MATKENTTNHRVGIHGNIKALKTGCNDEIGSKGLEKLGEKTSRHPQEYVSTIGNTIDTQINIRKFGEVFQDGLDNTDEMATKWNWKDNNHELNWRDKPISLRISYDSDKQELKVQVWNELIQVWARLSLSRNEILKILGG